MNTLKDKKLFLLDMDGTIYLDDDLFDGTLEFLECVKSIGGRYIFLTNNSSKSVDKYIEKLGKLGIPTTEDDFLPMRQYCICRRSNTIKFMLLEQLLSKNSWQKQAFLSLINWKTILIVCVWDLTQN